jgi:hypothetical protein
MGYVGGTQKRHEKRVSIFGHRAKVQTRGLTNTMQSYQPLDGNMRSVLWDNMAKTILKEKKMTKNHQTQIRYIKTRPTCSTYFDQRIWSTGIVGITKYVSSGEFRKDLNQNYSEMASFVWIITVDGKWRSSWDIK